MWLLGRVGENYQIKKKSKISGGVGKSCLYLNSDYCKYTKKEMGCKKLHPKDMCELQGCRESSCLNRHIK